MSPKGRNSCQVPEHFLSHPDISRGMKILGTVGTSCEEAHTIRLEDDLLTAHQDLSECPVPIGSTVPALPKLTNQRTRCMYSWRSA
ncbi:unnamed protein product [Nezara viridula]|uniref:Uncharacterized protein n=1 Tax=Nezara viridula TaxID=85310 RepID=A0A9P0MRT6_NEZVI|nr:unnamed protein product [Nezara viridula]